jgi:prepilin-type N-terminal cleavage/methylation domain-containing protein/prepilin-type processing-associated H-X9-DG protein
MKTHVHFRAFTLIELLVVIAVVAMLLGVLLPALARARAMAMKVVCAARMGQIATAFHSYAVCNQDRIPAASKVMTVSDPWIWSLLPYIQGDKTRESTLERPDELWFCPADKDPYPRGYSPHGQEYTSYALNGFYQAAKAGSGWTAATPEIRLGPAGRYPYSQIKSPSACMLMIETSYCGQVYDTDNPKVRPYRLPPEGHHRRTSGFYHKGQMNLMFVDGHVESIKGLPADAVPVPAPISAAGEMFWTDVSLPDSTENKTLWGPGY